MVSALWCSVLFPLFSDLTCFSPSFKQRRKRSLALLLATRPRAAWAVPRAGALAKAKVVVIPYRSPGRCAERNTFLLCWHHFLTRVKEGDAMKKRLPI